MSESGAKAANQPLSIEIQEEPAGRSGSPLREVLGKPLRRTSASAEPDAAGVRIEGVAIGRAVRRDPSGALWVDFPGNPSGAPIAAVAMASDGEELIGREVALLFEHGDPTRPIVLGPIWRATATEALSAEPSPVAEVDLDGERLTFTAQKEIVLRCGKASITLTRAGKVLIKGAYLLNRSTGVNRIKGGSVQIN